MHTDPVEVTLLLIGGIGPVFLLVRSLVSRSYLYAAWAKVAYFLATLAGLAWCILGFIVLQPLRLAPHTHALLEAWKYLCGGMVIGFTLTVLVARSFQKRSATHSPLRAAQPDLTNR